MSVDLLSMARSDDPGEQRQASDVAQGRVLYAALRVAADRNNERVDEDPSAEFHTDALAEAVLEYAAIIQELAK